jgi:glycosyltransferase involved in cell wall biosynthesis
MTTATRPPLVFVACQPPYPRDSGAPIRTHHLLVGLAQAFDTTFVTFEHGDDDGYGAPGEEDELQRLYPNVEVITVPSVARSKRSAQAASLIRRESWTNGRYRSRALAEAVRGAAASKRSPVVHFDDLGVAQIGPVAGAFNAYSSHNVEERILRHGARAGSAPRRLFSALEALKVRTEERSVWQSMDLSLAVSPLDARAMRDGGARRVELCPNGAPAVERLPLAARPQGEPLRLLFVGTGRYLSNERGVAWFVREVMPRIEACTPVVLEVVGHPPPRPVEAQGVRYVGTVPSVEPFYAASHGVVVPLFEGSGTRLKVLEAMAYGRPVISTGLGAEGLPVVAGEHYLQADDAERFAAAAIRMGEWWARPGDELERVIAGARAAVQPLLWPGIAARLAELYRSALHAPEERSASSVDLASLGR